MDVDENNSKGLKIKNEMLHTFKEISCKAWICRSFGREFRQFGIHVGDVNALLVSKTVSHSVCLESEDESGLSQDNNVLLHQDLLQCQTRCCCCWWRGRIKVRGERESNTCTSRKRWLTHFRDILSFSRSERLVWLDVQKQNNANNRILCWSDTNEADYQSNEEVLTKTRSD